MLKTVSEKNNLLFTLLQSFYWASICLSATFLTLYLESQGYNREQTGIIFAWGSISILIGQYFWGAICNRYGWLAHKQIIIFCMFIAIGFNLLFPTFIGNLVMIVALYSLFNFTYYSVAPLIDAWTMARKIDSPEINYGLTRGIGSAVYAVVAILFGFILSVTDLANMFIYSSLFVMVGVFVSLLIRPARVESEGQTVAISGFAMTLDLFKNARYVILLSALLFTFTASNANFSFYGLLISELGGTSYEFGIGMFISAMSEFVVMLLFASIAKKFSTKILLISSFIGLILKSLLFALSTELYFAIASQLLNAISFGLFLPACISYMTQIVKKSEITIAIATFASMSWGIAGITGNYFGGVVSQYFGIQTMFVMNACIAATGLAIFMLTYIYDRNKFQINHLNHSISKEQ
jgi:PPP family 3-phenylpropionic acid transporter